MVVWTIYEGGGEIHGDNMFVLQLELHVCVGGYELGSMRDEEERHTGDDVIHC